MAPLGLGELLRQSVPFISTLRRRELFRVTQGFYTILERCREVEMTAGRTWGGQRGRVPRREALKARSLGGGRAGGRAYAGGWGGASRPTRGSWGWRLRRLRKRGAGAQGDALEGRGRLGGGLGCVCRSRRGRRCVRMTRGEGPGRALPVPLLLPLEAAPRRRDLSAGKRRAAAPACATAPFGLGSGPHALALCRALRS